MTKIDPTTQVNTDTNNQPQGFVSLDDDSRLPECDGSQVTGVAASGLAHTTGSCDVSESPAPTAGQLLLSSDSSHATWQTPTLSTLSDGADAVRKQTLAHKGDMYVATGSATLTNLPIGSDGQVLTADSTQSTGMAWEAPGPASALVDTTGSVNVSLATAPSVGQVLTATNSTHATWQTPHGYTTVVVVAPTGVASTDTANIQAAINSLPSSGGTVSLREGTYNINSTLTLAPTPSNLYLIGQGIDATRLLADSTLGAHALLDFSASTSGANVEICSLTIDMNFSTRGGINFPDVLLRANTTTGRYTVRDVKYTNNTALGSNGGISVQVVPCAFENCVFLCNGASSLSNQFISVATSGALGLFSSCTFNATSSASLLVTQSCTITGCQFIVNVGGGSITCITSTPGESGGLGGPAIINGNIFKFISAASSSAVSILSSGTTPRAIVSNNVTDSASIGGISAALGTNVIFVGNLGFSSYTGTTQLSANF